MGRKISTEVAVRALKNPALKNRWQVQWWVGLGPSRHRETMTFPTEADAHEHRARILAAFDAMPVVAEPGTPVLKLTAGDSLAAFVGYGFDAATKTWKATTPASGWIAEMVSRKKPGTRVVYDSVLRNHILPALGHTLVSDATLGTPQIMALMGRPSVAGTAWGNQVMILRVLSSACEHARFLKKLSTNPCAKLVKYLKPADAVEPEPNPLTRDQFDAFISWVAEHHPAWATYFSFLGKTGVRQGEAAALRIDRLKLDGPKYSVRPMATVDANYSPAAGQDATTKTNHVRQIYVAPALVPGLRKQIAATRASLMARGLPATPYVFVTARGARIIPNFNTAVVIFHAGMEAIGADHEHHTIHDLRDTFATLHLQQNPAKLLWVSGMLGHKKPTTTMNRYTKWVPQSMGADYAADLDGMALPAAASGSVEPEPAAFKPRAFAVVARKPRSRK